LLISSSSRFVRIFHSPFSYLGPYDNIYPCNKNQLDAIFTLGLFRRKLLHVSGIFVAHHQEVYCVCTATGTCCALQLTVCWPGWNGTTDSQQQSTTRTNCCIYTVYLLMMCYTSSSGTERPLVFESYGLLNDIFPFPSILDAGYPIFNLHLANVLFDFILPSVIGSSL